MVIFLHASRRARAALLRLLLLCTLALLAAPGALGVAPARADSFAASVTRASFANGALIRDTSNGRVYVLWDGRRHWINSPQTFNLLGYDQAQIQNVVPSVIASVPNGTALGTATVAGGLVWPLAPIVADPVHLDLSAPSVSAGGSLQLNGSGFVAGESVALTVPNATLTATANGSGAFSITVPILSNVDLGLHHIYAQGTQSGLFGVQVFQVVVPAPAPSIQSSPSPVVVGTTLNVSGSGFSPGETIEIFLAGGAATTTLTANSSGAFGPVGIGVPANLSLGSHSLRAYGTSSFRMAGQDVTIASAAPTPTATPTPAPLHPTVGVNPGSVPAGAQVVVSGSGYRPGETVLIRFNGALQGGVTAAADGSFDGVLLTVPAGTAAGTYAVTGTGATSGAAAGASLTVQSAQPPPPAAITINPSAVVPGGQVQVAGTGFQSGEPLLLSFNNVVVQNLTADAGGSFTNGSLTVPATLPPGQYGVTVLGTSSGRAANAVLRVSAPPPVPVARLYLNPATVIDGARVSISGSGYGANEGVLIRINGAPLLEAPANGVGAFTLTFAAHLRVGQYSVSGQGTQSGRISQATLRVVQPVRAGIGLSPSRARRGGTVAVGGDNFAPHEFVLIRFRGVLVQAVQADGLGRFHNARFVVPGNTPYGLSTVSIAGQSSSRTASALLLVVPAKTVGARIHLSATTLHRGSAVTVSGSGFAGGEIVVIRYRGGFVQAAQVDRHGNFKGASFHIPVNSPYGNFHVGASGTHSGRSAAVLVHIVPAPPHVSLSVSPRIVRQNGVVVVSGGGFAGGEVVAFFLRGAYVYATLADRHGNFRFAYRVPGGGARGVDTLLAQGTRSHRHAQTTLVIV